MERQLERLARLRDRIVTRRSGLRVVAGGVVALRAGVGGPFGTAGAPAVAARWPDERRAAGDHADEDEYDDGGVELGFCFPEPEPWLVPPAAGADGTPLVRWDSFRSDAWPDRFSSQVGGHCAEPEDARSPWYRDSEAIQLRHARDLYGRGTAWAPWRDWFCLSAGENRIHWSRDHHGEIWETPLDEHVPVCITNPPLRHVRASPDGLELFATDGALSRIARWARSDQDSPWLPLAAIRVGDPEVMGRFRGSELLACSDDGLELQVMEDRGDRLAVWTRAGRSDPWLPQPTRRKEDLAGNELGTPWSGIRLTPDGLELGAARRDTTWRFTGVAPGDPGLAILTCQRSDPPAGRPREGWEPVPARSIGEIAASRPMPAPGVIGVAFSPDLETMYVSLPEGHQVAWPMAG